MDIILKPSGGQNIVLRPWARPTWYQPATVAAHEVELFRQEIDETGALVGVPVSLGRFPAESTIRVPNNPDTDKNVRFFMKSYAPDGTPDVSSLKDAVAVTVLVQRETAAPIIGQQGAATAELLTVGVDGFSRFAHKRQVRIADNALMTDASVFVRDSESYINRELPRYIDISRSALLTADFSWTGNDPAANGFTKTGTGTTATSSSPAGWRITTTGGDAQTYYSKNSLPATPFTAGFTLELVPPSVVAADNANPSLAVAVRVDDGAHKYELTFDADEVKLNGGAAHLFGASKVRLVVAPGGAVADLWIGDTKVENDTASAAGSALELVFGDLAGANDAEAVWSSLAYALTPQDVRLAETIYVRVSHSSGGAYGAECAASSFTFASEAGAGGSTGDFDPTPRDTLTLN